MIVRPVVVVREGSICKDRKDLGVVEGSEPSCPFSYGLATRSPLPAPSSGIRCSTHQLACRNGLGGAQAGAQMLRWQA